MDIDITSNKHGGNPESMEAYRSSSSEERRRMRDRIYRYAVRMGGFGITADEVAAKSGLVHNRVAPRISELRKEGRLIETTIRRPTRLGKSARVLIAAEFAS